MRSASSRASGDSSHGDIANIAKSYNACASSLDSTTSAIGENTFFCCMIFISFHSFRGRHNPAIKYTCVFNRVSQRHRCAYPVAVLHLSFGVIFHPPNPGGLIAPKYGCQKQMDFPHIYLSAPNPALNLVRFAHWTSRLRQPASPPTESIAAAASITSRNLLHSALSFEHLRCSRFRLFRIFS
jgi:hypothetical protein